MATVPINLTDWHGVVAGTSPATVVRAANKLTPMPLPRMGHHYVMPTMAMMPGHLAHPLYQKYTVLIALVMVQQITTQTIFTDSFILVLGPNRAKPT